MKAFYEPTAEHLTRLSGPWCASYSGGKDSTSLVTWIEWLRRSGWITVERPQLVQSDTGVEDQKLQSISNGMLNILRCSGWECTIVSPSVDAKLYCQILGRGLGPIHPGAKQVRWCTRSTKTDPMRRWHAEKSSGVMLTGLRWGESAIRDEKMRKSFCAAGGECGIPEQSETTYSPIINWTLCQVLDWLTGVVSIRKVMRDIFTVTRRLVEAYEVSVGQSNFLDDERAIQMGRWGCNGCPAITAGRQSSRRERKRLKGSPLLELPDAWFEARKHVNRLLKIMPDGRLKYGPIRMAFRKVLFERVMDIQRRAGVTLITPEDEVFIRQCWENKVYPRGWSQADEANEAPLEPLYQDAEAE